MASQSSLNHVYRTVWNEALGAMVAVAEAAPSHQGGRGAAQCVAPRKTLFAGSWPQVGTLSVAVALCWGAASSADANPVGGVAVQGQASMATNGNVLTVTTQNATGTNFSAINWQSFSIAAPQTTRIDQPNAGSMSINRVVTNTPSQLFGTLSSNGKVVLVNQSGIAVGAGAQVDTAGFTASVLGLSDQDALAGRLRFGNSNVGSGSGALTVQGNIIGRGGDVVLIAPSIELAQSAVVESQGGSVVLAAGRSVEITGRGLEGITMQVQAPTDQAINLGTLKGDAVGIFAGTLRHSGVIQATQATLEGGQVVLKASGDAYVEGDATISATSSNGKGGSVSVLGNRVALTDNARIDVSGATGGGTVLVGGDFQGKNAAIQNAAITFVGNDTHIVADATDHGDGGKAIIWADDTTRAYGNVSARAGANGGNGGFVEISGHRYLDFQGHTDTGAAHGRVGTLLLDPTNIAIDVGPDAPGGGGFTGGVFSGATGDSVLTWATINGQVGALTLQSSPGGSSSGDININVSGSVSGPSSLSLLARNNINFATGVSVNAGSVDVNLVAGWDGNPGTNVSPSFGTIAFNPSSSLSTTGKVWLNAGNNVAQDPSASITANAMIVTTYGTFPVSMLGPNQVGTLAVSLSGASTGIQYAAGSSGVTVGSVSMTGPGTVSGINTSNGSIALSDSSSGTIAINADVKAGSSGVTIQQTGSGNVSESSGATVSGYSVLMSTAGAASTINSNGGIVAGLGGANLTAPGGITLNGLNSSAGLTLTTTNSPVTQSGGNAIVVSGTTTVSAGSGDIQLQTNTNDLPTISLSGGAVKVNATNGMSVTSLTSGANKGVALVAGGALALPASAINTGTADLQLSSGSNLSPSANLAGTNIQLSGTTGVGLAFNVNASGTLDISASAGAVTQTGGTIVATGATTVSAGAGQVSLMSASNDFSSIAATATGGSVWFADTNAVVLNAISGTSVDIQTGGPLTQSAGVINTPGALTLTTAGGATLNNANTVASLSATNTGSGGVSFTNSGALSAAVTNTPSTGTVKILNTGNLTLSGAISSGAPGDAVVLSTTGNFLNPSNFNINLTGAGTPRWLIYSTSPAANNDGALLQSAAMFQQYGASYPTAAAQSTGDGFLYSASSIPVAVTLSGSVSKVYDGSAAATLTSANYALGSVTDGMFGASTGVALTSVGTGTYDTPNAGTGKLVTSTGGTTQVNFAGGKTIYGYQLGSGSAAIGTITPAPVTVTTVNASLVGSTTKVYDGTTAAVLTPGNFSLTGFVGNDNANVTQTTGTYAGKNVGTGLSVSATLAPTDFSPVGGTILSNYVLPTTASGNIGTITPRPLGVAATAASKVFDGTTVATVTGYGLSGFVVGETVGATSSSANFDTKDVGNGKTVTIAGISLVNGTGLASNYSVVNTTTAQANITAPATTNPPPPVPVPPITVPPVRTVTPSPTPTDFFVTFLEKFEVAVLDQEHRRGRKVNANSDVVVEGELCRP